MDKLKQLQKRILDISYHHKLGHLGSCLSALPIILEIYEKKEEDDIFILSSGHVALALYVVLEHFYGYDAEQLFDKFGVHPKFSKEYKIFCSSGSLGQGITVGVGYALSNKNRKVYVLFSDGESAEGSVWESLKFITESKVDNMELYINANGVSAISFLDIPYLERCLSAFHPGIHFRYPSVEVFSFLKGLEAHYKVMNEENYQQALNEL